VAGKGEMRRIGWLCFWPKERRRKSVCRGSRFVWPRVRVTKGKMAGAKMGVGSVCLWQREGAGRERRGKIKATGGLCAEKKKFSGGRRRLGVKEIGLGFLFFFIFFVKIAPL